MHALLFLQVSLLFRRFGFDGFDELLEIGTHFATLAILRVKVLFIPRQSVEEFSGTSLSKESFTKTAQVVEACAHLLECVRAGNPAVASRERAYGLRLNHRPRP